jgi:hypothetical protein
MFSQIRQLFRRFDPIPAPWLASMAAFRNGFRAISPASDVIPRADGGVDIDFYPEIALDAANFSGLYRYSFPYRLWLRRVAGGGYQYAISEQHPDLATGVAGRIYKPDGTCMTVARIGWAGISVATTITFYLQLSINEGTCSATIVTAAPTVNAKADPAILSYEIATITVTAGVYTVLQKLNYDVPLVGAIIPAWYTGYDLTGTEQILIHGKSAAPKWFLTAGSGDRVLYHKDDDTIAVLATSSSSTEYLLSCDSSVIAWAEGGGSCP